MVLNMVKIVRNDRVSIDLDTKNRFILLKTHFNMKWLLRLYNKKDEIIDDRETNKGYHVVGKFKKRTPEQNMQIRRILGDCEGRLELDELRLNAGLGDCIETLFFFKKVSRNGKTVISREEPLNIMAEQFWGFKL